MHVEKECMASETSSGYAPPDGKGIISWYVPSGGSVDRHCGALDVSVVPFGPF